MAVVFEIAIENQQSAGLQRPGSGLAGQRLLDAQALRGILNPRRVRFLSSARSEQDECGGKKGVENGRSEAMMHAMAMKKKMAGTRGKNRVIIRTPASSEAQGDGEVCLAAAAGADEQGVLPVVDGLPLGQFKHDGLWFDGCWPKETVSAPFSNLSRTQPQSPAGASSSGGIEATKGRLG